MGIKDLPGPGLKFRAKTGVGNFQRKLKLAARYGDLRNLQDNIKEIVDVAKQYERVIKVKGGLSRLQKRDAWLKIKRSTPSPTRADKYEIKAILNHLGRGAATKEKKPVVEETSVKVSDGKSYLTQEQVRRNLLRSKARDEFGSKIGTYSQPYAGGVVKSYGIHGAMERIGVDRGQVGFAADNKKSKLPGDSAPNPKAPPAGIRPIGL